VPIEDLVEIEGFDDELAEELRSRAHAYLAEKEIEYAARRLELGVADELAELPGLTGAMLVTLGEAEIKTLDDLADLAGDELTHSEEGVLREFGLSETDANAIIMAARAHWFDDEPETPAEDLAEGVEAAADVENPPAAG
jgi:N utilization substance protein A